MSSEHAGRASTAPVDLRFDRVSHTFAHAGLKSHKATWSRVARTEVAQSDVEPRGGRRSPRSLAVLDDISLTVASGEFVAVVGPSGAGKSTLLKLAAGLLRPQRGTVTIAGHDVRGQCAYQPQRDLLLPWRRVLGNTTLAADAAGEDRHRSRARALALLERVGLAEFAQAWPAQLSGGMRQRVALLRTHLSPRPVVLLDEPLGSLDALTRRDLQQWLEELHLAAPRATLLVTHDIEEALLLADRVVVLSDRPATIAAVHPVDLERPRPPGIETTPRFIAARAAILDSFRTRTFTSAHRTIDRPVS